MSPAVDLNADVGESTGAQRYGDDEGVMPHITSANIACGFHAGDPGVMRATVALARAHGVAVGAHPGLRDLAGFGRREMPVSPAEVEDLVAYQIGALAGVAAAQGVRADARQAARRAVQHGRARSVRWRTPSCGRCARWTRRSCCSGWPTRSWSARPAMPG